MNISILLMLLAIIAIVVFQSYWLSKTFREEKQDLAVRTNVIFRESANECQMAKLKLDSNVKIRYTSRPTVTNTLNVLRKRLNDSIWTKKEVKTSALMFANKEKIVTVTRKDSIRGLPGSNHPIRVFNLKTGSGLLQILEGVDSLQDTVTVKELSDKYASLLKREKISLDFAIASHPGAFEDEMEPPDLQNANEITMGFSKPTTYTLDVHGITGYILRKMLSQILVSFLLVGLTVFSFIILLRNLMQQNRLTQIKNEFISNITHELKTPIATVSVAIEALKNFNALQDPQRTREYLDISGNELQRLSLLVDKVLKLSMFEKQQIELKVEKFDLKQLMEEVVDTMKLQFEKYKAQVNIHLHGENFIVEGDRLHITSVIYNLLDNALKYGRVNPAIQIDLKDDATGIEMSVTDNGVGIPIEYQKKIFDKFFRVPSGDTHNVKGYGLGLSYVAYVVHRHKGTIQVESQPGIGSRFIIKFPKTT
jgi:two-component system, OmpR family, phosphate regulon sensor histidine kinase PhoR